MSIALGALISRRATVALVLLTAAGCGDTVDEAASTAGPSRVTAGDLHVLPPAESLAVVEDLAVLPNGTLWVLNSVEPFFLQFSEQGDVLDAHGRIGGGPAEFGAPSGFVVDGSGDEAWIFDRRRHSLVQVSGLSEQRTEILLPADLIPPGSVLTGMDLMSDAIRTARLGDEVLLFRRAGTGEIQAISFWTTIWGADLVAFDPATDSVRTVLSLPATMGDLTTRFEGLSGGFPPFPLWYRLWAVCADEEIRLYDFVRDELRGFTADGVELEPVPVPTPFTEATPRQFARAVFDLAAAEQAGAVTSDVAEMSAADSAQTLSGVSERLDGTPQQLGDLLPKYVDFRCADDGTMWLRPLDLVRGGMKGGPGWLRISPDGQTREVAFPERFDPYRFTSTQVWGVLRDELNVASLAWTEAAPQR